MEKADQVQRVLTERSVSGKITCTAARGIAEEFGVAYADVGAAANALGIKISSCELGCF